MDDQKKITDDYNQYHYQTGIYPQTHPNRLYVNACLRGLTPPPVTRCRVLEVGTGDATNLLSMALQFPESEFVGIDISETEVKKANQTIKTLGLKNIRVQEANILTYTPEPGKTDYLIAHGIFSWVPAPVREKLLALSQRALSPTGIAYISYNAYPGRHRQAMLRDFLLYFCQEENIEAKVQHAHEMLAAFETSFPSQDSLYKDDLLYETKRVLALEDYSLVFDILAGVNQAFYFHEFMNHASNAGFQFLSEAEWHSMTLPTLPEAFQPLIKQTENKIIEREQLLDFITNRYFRETLLCHRDIKLSSDIHLNAIKHFKIKTYLTPLTTYEKNQPSQFQTQDQQIITITDAITKATLTALCHAKPHAISYSTLIHHVKKLLELEGDYLLYDKTPQLFEPLLLESLYKTYTQGLVFYFDELPDIVSTVSNNPFAWPLAREQAKEGLMVGNSHHENIAINNFIHHLLPHLDGKHTHSALLAVLLELTHQQKIHFSLNGRPVTDDTALTSHLENALNDALVRIAHAGLLVR